MWKHEKKDALIQTKMSEHSLQCIAEEMKSIVCMGEPEQV